MSGKASKVRRAVLSIVLPVFAHCQNMKRTAVGIVLEGESIALVNCNCYDVECACVGCDDEEAEYKQITQTNIGVERPECP